MVQGLQTLRLHKQLIQSLSSLTELLVLIILSHKGLHHTDGRDILLNGTVQVVVTQEYLCEEFSRLTQGHLCLGKRLADLIKHEGVSPWGGVYIGVLRGSGSDHWEASK